MNIVVTDRYSLVEWLLTKTDTINVAQIEEWVEVLRIKLRYKSDGRNAKNTKPRFNTSLDFFFALDTIEALLKIESCIEEDKPICPYDLVTLTKLDFFNCMHIKDLTRVVLFTVHTPEETKHYWMDTRNGIIKHAINPKGMNLNSDLMSYPVVVDLNRFQFGDGDELPVTVNYRYVNDPSLITFMDAVSKVSYYIAHPSRIQTAKDQFTEAMCKFIQIREIFKKWN